MDRNTVPGSAGTMAHCANTSATTARWRSTSGAGEPFALGCSAITTARSSNRSIRPAESRGSSRFVRAAISPNNR